jgi:hypothetical protein
LVLFTATSLIAQETKETIVFSGNHVRQRVQSFPSVAAPAAKYHKAHAMVPSVPSNSTNTTAMAPAYMNSLSLLLAAAPDANDNTNNSAGKLSIRQQSGLVGSETALINFKTAHDALAAQYNGDIVTLLNNGADIPATVTTRQNQFLSDLQNLVNTQNAKIWSGLATVNAPRKMKRLP